MKNNDFDLISCKLDDIKSFNQGDPFPHAVVDDFLPSSVIDKIYSLFPSPNSGIWERYKYEHQIKLVTNEVHHLSDPLRSLIYFLNSGDFINSLEKMTGINNILCDPHFYGAGLHQIERGGRLSVHADFSQLENCKLYRRLNLILYLNPNWEDAFGGCLELWDAKGENLVKSISPIMNRCVIFKTTTTSFHGHPRPLNCPEGLSRKSIALYYYTVEQDSETLGVDTRWRTAQKSSFIHRIRRGAAIFFWRVLLTFKKSLINFENVIDKCIKKIDVN